MKIYQKELMACDWYHIPPDEIVLFCSFSEYDIPVGYVFNTITDAGSRILVTDTITLKGVTQQFWKPFDSIPKGWKTIARFSFQHGVPDAISAMPQLESWYANDNFLYLKGALKEL
ncbi:hypothetical protein [Chitinophaga caseinilytica]|uniref:hypothetical protein n=1 Tax=Chitinophaga caseinilytica TaxID=2267521 RepID=UPI003C2C9BE1